MLQALDEEHWTTHHEMVPYGAPDSKYVVNIRRLDKPKYLVVIEIVDKRGQVVASTPEIEADTDSSNVQIKCDLGERGNIGGGGVV